jgi:hypothetical protein
MKLLPKAFATFLSVGAVGCIARQQSEPLAWFAF